ncbi:sensor domain-containing diguanylate cyclase [Vibrio fluvialis]|uniref:sensor domain-containing diguanylate cyclase n=1 Tax=Vibrio fluvialis TaxID=676 RepID=UPI0030808AB9
MAYLVQQRYTKTMFENLADRQVQSLQQFVNSDIHFIGSGANFFHSVSPMNWSRFRIYASDVLSGSKSLIGLQWLQRIEVQDIPAYEAKMAKRYQNDKWVLIGLGIGGSMIALLLGFVSHLLIREKETLNTKLEERTKELRFMVEHDSLTGIFNRRAFNRILDVYVRDQKPFTLVSFDIDNFKSINDRYSHLAGDQVLVAVTKTIETLLDPADIFVRTGGDEFSILCHVTEPEQLKSYLETIRRTVELSRFDTDYHQLSVSLSIGAAINEGYSEQELLQRADTMLYESKAKGRNQVSIAD